MALSISPNSIILFAVTKSTIIEASEENFKKSAAGYKYLHLATHGLLNEGHPKLSGLIFSQPTDSGRVDDGILYAGEIFNLTTNADLVVLSSCESGLGKMERVCVGGEIGEKSRQL